MYRESAGSDMESTDRFIESEMIISRGFMVSAQKMFGDGYKAIIRNLSHEYGNNIIKYLAGDTDLTNLTDIEKLQLLFERGVSADYVNVKLGDNNKLIQNVLNRGGIGGSKDAGEYEETGECVIHFDLMED